MKTKIVYSVVSCPNDYYLEQTLMSVFTLRHYNPDADVVLVVDSETKTSLSGNRLAIKKYVNEVVSVEIPKDFDNNFKSRYLKTTLRNYVLGDFLFIDSDTLIVTSLEEADRFDCDLGAVPDMHVKISSHPRKDFILLCSKIASFSYNDDSYYMNSGVFYVKDNEFTHKFYEQWHNNWIKCIRKGFYPDQAPLAKTNEELGYPIQNIGGYWNCQLSDNGLKYFSNCKIIHYFASSAKTSSGSPFSYYQPCVYNQIKKSGDIPLEIINIILNPQSGFIDKCKIITADDIDLVGSHIHEVYQISPWFYLLLNGLSNIYIKLYKTIKSLMKWNKIPQSIVIYLRRMFM